MVFALFGPDFNIFLGALRDILAKMSYREDNSSAD